VIGLRQNRASFVDTNVLIYAHDADAGRKHEIARELLRTLWTARSGILSTQVRRRPSRSCDTTRRAPTARGDGEDERRRQDHERAAVDSALQRVAGAVLPLAVV
jgi:predicted nucleic acid-binding protein